MQSEWKDAFNKCLSCQTKKDKEDIKSYGSDSNPYSCLQNNLFATTL